MPLQSRLFRGDPKLEAAAVSDPAHIVPGAHGDHVRKIQLALIQLDRAAIDSDGSYGPATAAAVLAYKQKRRIINPSYQTQADNIVGRMTMAALDGEIAIAERVVTRPIILPLRPAARPVRHEFPGGTPRAAGRDQFFAPVSARSGIASFNLFGAPSFSVLQIEIDTDDVGAFRVIGGKNERLFVENVRVGLLIDPNEPLRERAVLDITSDQQTFQVKGVGQGATRLLVTTHEGIFSNAGTVSIGLVVRAKSIEKLWRPTLKAVRTPPRKRSPFMFNGALGVQIASEMFAFDGSVNPAPEIRAGDFEIGFVQTLVESMMEGVYTDDSGGQRRIFESTVHKLPVRDSDGATPWAKPEAVRELASARTVHFEDRPANVLPWQSPDKRVTLRSSSGSDRFITFFIARHKRTSEVTVLGRVHWLTSWEYSFDFSKEQATPVGRDGIITAESIGPGPEEPILGGDTALKTLKVGFRP